MHVQNLALASILLDFARSPQSVSTRGNGLEGLAAGTALFDAVRRAGKAGDRHRQDRAHVGVSGVVRPAERSGFLTRLTGVSLSTELQEALAFTAIDEARMNGLDGAGRPAGAQSSTAEPLTIDFKVAANLYARVSRAGPDEKSG